SAMSEETDKRQQFARTVVIRVPGQHQRAVRGGSDPMSEPTAEKQDEARWGSTRLREQDRRAPQDTAVRGNVVLNRTRIACGAESACCASRQPFQPITANLVGVGRN